jgi:uncharacterized protein YPO0396
MKVMTKLLLIHWHYFGHELIEFGGLNFLTGKNASGKSTIIDALQLILLGDTSGSFFNKAASGRGNRTLKGYLMGELGDDEESGFHYLRNGRFTSYVVLEFFDDEKKRYFTAGCCFDTYSENDTQKLFFQYDGVMHENGFMINRTPIDIPALRSFLKERYPNHFDTTDVGRDFRTKLYGKLGGLRDRFAGLLKKAVSFNPDVDIQRFISEFVCDTQQAVDVSHMQENIQSYKRLEAESEILKERIELLGKIVDEYQTYSKNKADEILYSYLIERASTDMKKNELAKAEEDAKAYTKQLENLSLKISNSDNRLRKLRSERDVLNAEMLTDKNAQALKNIERDINEKKSQIHALQDEYDKAHAMLHHHISEWIKRTEAMIQKLSSSENSLREATIISRANDLCLEARDLLAKTRELSQISPEIIMGVGDDGIARLSLMANHLKTHAIELSSRMRDEQDAVANKRAILKKEEESLERGIYHFPQDVIDLKAAVASRLRTLAKQEVRVLIVAETAEVKNDRWRNVIEGFLNTQKFYIIVPPEYYKDALRVFDAIKRQKKIYSTGIVDIEKLKRLNPAADPGSLAEEMETDDDDVRAFLNYTLGRVQKCENVTELRRFRTAVTDDGMLYQNFVVRAMNPERWARPAIGQGAIQKRLHDVRTEIQLLTQEIIAYAEMKIGIENVSNLETMSSLDITRVVTAAKEVARIPILEEELLSMNESLAAINRSAIDSLEKRINDLDGNISEQEKQLDSDKDSKSKTELRLEECRQQTIPKLTLELQAMETKITEQYTEEWLEAVGFLRYERELLQRGRPDAIASAFPRELSRVRNAREDAWEELLDWRRSYNDKYKTGYDIKKENNDAYDEAWLELTDNKLPDYLTRIADAREKAFEQFQEDFLSRLQNNINSAKRQIDELNGALKGSSFGEDTYRFRIVPKPEYKRFYDMIVDEMLLQGGYNLLSEQYNAKYKDEIADLFAIITGDERRVYEFTDYRTYLSFDLEVINREGESQRLSKTLGKKSGGETQTPFYVAVLASFAQLYRVGREKTAKTSRLIIFDEAFSKMDGERIVKSIELLKKFDFQAILSAPPDKIGDIATLVDRNLCVLRDGKHTCVKSFDPKQAEAILYE